MLTFDRLVDTAVQEKTAVALGYFDGLHRGHMAVIELAISQPERLAAVFTYDLPAKTGRAAQGLLLTHADKLTQLEQKGVKLVLCPDFSEFSGMSPERFVQEVLCERLNAGYVSCGEDFRFGHAASAGMQELQALCAARGIETGTPADVLHDGRRISSTWIRELLATGDAEQAAKLLGRPFGYRLPVVEGKRLGRTIGSPTINQTLPEALLCPRYGVYASAVRTPGGWRTGVTNIGLRPTVEQTARANSETYIHDFAGDLYGKEIEVRLLAFLRAEQKFSGVEQLRAQIAADAAAALPAAEAYVQQL